MRVEEINFRRRWFIFLSILGQKFLQFVSKPLSELGSGIEVALNLIPSNRKCVCARAQFPPRQAGELDSSIKHDDANYHAALSAMASKASYENSACIETIVKNHWKGRINLINDFDSQSDNINYQGKATTQAFLLRDKTCDQDTIVLAFRGTEPFDADAWCSDFDFSWYELYGVGKIHGGFMKALGLHKNDGWPKEEVKQDGKPPRPRAYYAIRDMLNKLLKQNDESR
ncbi:alpha/beta-Hydrolases superfamily protein [Prunus dulcis]|uniref:Alpha/beta-Hydrolases superfamily protein n=1 Tax=Prunus dulcis TaxID=3755 RepID=A0A4Y1RTX3_PRUDU|nr:alpha/beta-Hydrolases superfamily protein [Prunus dulcis]